MKRPQNTYDAFLQTLYHLHQQNKKPKLLLHACCGPCASSALCQLYDYFDITIYFTNDNIFPKSEYYRRLEELKNFIPKFNRDYHASVGLIIKEYDPTTWLSAHSLFKDNKEGQYRCHLCYAYRLKQTMEYASSHGFEYVATVLTLSRLKNSKIINEIGITLNKEFPSITYLETDFKKNKGIDLSIDLTTHYHMYRQDYCGCPYSMPKEK